jgi:sugar phosphate isomerase/epimerase
MNIEESSIEQGLLTAGNRLWHVHIADSNRQYPGSGHIPYGPIFATLRQMGYQGYISAELRPLPDPDTAAQKTIEFLKKQFTDA